MGTYLKEASCLTVNEMSVVRDVFLAAFATTIAMVDPELREKYHTHWLVAVNRSTPVQMLTPGTMSQGKLVEDVFNSLHGEGFAKFVMGLGARFYMTWQDDQYAELARNLVSGMNVLLGDIGVGLAVSDFTIAPDKWVDEVAGKDDKGIMRDVAEDNYKILIANKWVVVIVLGWLYQAEIMALYKDLYKESRKPNKESQTSAVAKAGE